MPAAAGRAAPQLIDSTGTVREEPRWPTSRRIAAWDRRSVALPPNYTKTCTVLRRGPGKAVSYPALIDPS